MLPRCGTVSYLLHDLDLKPEIEIESGFQFAPAVVEALTHVSCSEHTSTNCRTCHAFVEHRYIHDGFTSRHRSRQPVLGQDRHMHQQTKKGRLMSSTEMPRKEMIDQ